MAESGRSGDLRQGKRGYEGGVGFEVCDMYREAKGDAFIKVKVVAEFSFDEIKMDVPNFPVALE